MGNYLVKDLSNHNKGAMLHKAVRQLNSYNIILAKKTRSEAAKKSRTKYGLRGSLVQALAERVHIFWSKDKFALFSGDTRQEKTNSRKNFFFS